LAATTRGIFAGEVVPGTFGADLDVVTEHRFAAPTEPVQLGDRGGATAARGKASAEHICHLDGIGPLTDGALFAVGPADVARRSKQLGMGVAHVLATEASLLDLADDGIAHEAVLDTRLARGVLGLLVGPGSLGRCHRWTG